MVDPPTGRFVEANAAVLDLLGYTAAEFAALGMADLVPRESPEAVARYGGEEFAVIVPDTDHAGAVVLAERLRRAVAAVAWDKRPVTISVGVATRTPGTADAAALVREADDALYRSKRGGRNRVSHGSQAISHTATVRA